MYLPCINNKDDADDVMKEGVGGGVGCCMKTGQERGPKGIGEYQKKYEKKKCEVKVVAFHLNGHA